MARFFNVVQSQGNVFEIWDNIDKHEPLYVVSECNRYFISLDEAVGLILFSMTSEPGRYIVNTPELRNMAEVAKSIYPDRERIEIPRRRGDRKSEIFLATSENSTKEVLSGKVLKVFGDHDRVEDKKNV